MDIKTTLQTSSLIIALSIIYALIFSIEAGR
jgi:hypothetical protein